MNQKLRKWLFAVDQGGTFTDVIGLDPEGKYHVLKLLSSSSAYDDASIEGIRRMLGTKRGGPLPEEKIGGVRFGTTVATNALLEKKGGKTGLVITKGFSGLLDIGYQNRPSIFSLCIKKAPPLYCRVIEADERIDTGGRVIRELDLDSLRADIRELVSEGVDAVAVVFMHSWRNPAHEILCEEVLKDHGVSNIFLSYRTSNLIKIVGRGQSTVVDAYLSVVLSDYLAGIRKSTGNIPVEFMQSNGALAPPADFRGRNALYSGPAGGLLAVAHIAEEMGMAGVIGFDMGGTSTDVSKFDGRLERKYEEMIGGLPLQVEMLHIVTIAAGGGSILGFDGMKMTVGPESAGSNPGPACYRFGGPLTITDANLMTGRILPGHFPKTFGPAGNAPLDSALVRERFISLASEVNGALGTDFTVYDIANGYLRVANEKMAIAVKEISVSRGFDVREYALVCFGGAGGQHACALAEILGINTIIIHPLGSVMSAYGIGLAKPAWKTEQTLLLHVSKQEYDKLSLLFDLMEKQFPGEKRDSGGKYEIKKEIDLRPVGAETFLTLEYGSYEETMSSFEAEYRRHYGFVPSGKDLEVVNARLEIRELLDYFGPFRDVMRADVGPSSPVSCEDVWFEGTPSRVPVYRRESLLPDTMIEGPCIIVDSNSTVVLEAKFRAVTEGSGILLIKRSKREDAVDEEAATGPDPVLLEVFNNLFMGTATEMGLTLRNTAHSVNMKERLDFSCAVFDPEGDLVANAPHIPVHLGAMADTVRAISRENLHSMRPGDFYLANNPYRGGSHLPDMTVVCPVFSDGDKIAFFVAARGHHSDVGGITPGSMPPSATHIDEEGVLIDNFLLVRDGIFREEALTEMLSCHRYPVRNIRERIADLRAQIASCHRGMSELDHIMKRYGVELIKKYMKFIQVNASYSIKKALFGFLGSEPRSQSTFKDVLDDGTAITVSVLIEAGDNPPESVRATIDFTGTGPQRLSDNMNAPVSVTHSAVLYVLRTLLETDIPLNSGCLRPVTLIIPAGTILNPLYPAPVASGNVETSQRVVDVLLGALGVAAASQGTMNNLLFEVEGETPYYETIAGGAGATADCHGASGVQVHMTNTRITDPEVLEFRHPGIRLKRFTLRKGSGGVGRFRGGDGVIREIAFLRPAIVSILSERRVYPPYGLEGGGAGKKGINRLRKCDGKVIVLGHRAVVTMNRDDTLIIETPGGGGFGKA